MELRGINDTVQMEYGAFRHPAQQRVEKYVAIAAGNLPRRLMRELRVAVAYRRIAEQTPFQG